MKKIFAFLLAFTFCFLCFGTYGFEDATVCTEDHDHSSHVHAADDDLYLTISVDSDYDADDEELTVTIDFDMSESVDLDDDFKITIDASSRLDGDNKNNVSCNDKVFGADAEITNDAVIFDVSDGGDTDNWDGDRITIVYEVDDSYFTTKSRRQQTISIKVSNAKSDTGDTISVSATSFTVYVCEHTSSTYEKVLVAATCSKEGTEAEVCSACDCVVDTNLIYPIDHDLDFSKPFTNIYAYTAPTCTTTGWGQFKCKLCNTLVTSSVPKSHTYGPSTVNSNGYYVRECTKCGSIDVSDCAHNFKYSSTKTTATCEVKGVEIYKCSKCGETEERTTDYANHKYGSWTTTKEATCNAKGEKVRTCSVCDKIEKQDIAMIDHDYGEWKLIEEATCISDGLERRTCKECGERDERTTEKSGHKYGGWKVDTAATCVSTGMNKRTCSLCGDVETEVTDKVAHTYGAWTVSKAATCVATGIEKRVCAVCQGEDTRTLAIDVNGHAYGEWKAVTPKTCITNGVSNRTCSLCQHVDERVDEATGHVFGPVDVDGKLTTKKCSCGYTEVIKTGKKGNTKTLTDYSGSLEVTGANADKNVLFEIAAMTMDTEADYKKYHNFDKGYTYKVLVDGETTPITSDMTMTLKLDGSFENCEVGLAVLRNNVFYTLTEYDRDGLEITINGADLAGTESIFVTKGDEMAPNYWLPIVITVAILAIAGVAVFVIMSKNKSKNTFN